MKWIITANSNDCKIYKQLSDQLLLIKEISHPENKLKSHDLGTDRPGHYQTGASAHGAYSPHHDKQETNIDNFAREIAHVLNDARNQNEYNELITIMPAHMDGLLIQHLNKHVQQAITQTIQKNIMHLSTDELLTLIKES
jgi:protein required for attachment to host cells